MFRQNLASPEIAIVAFFLIQAKVGESGDRDIANISH